MTMLTVHAGDFEHMEFAYGVFLTNKPDGGWGMARIEPDQVESVELASEDSVKRLGGTIGWGAVGGALLGPAGLLAGLLLGGRGKKVTFVVRFKDGRKLLATTDSKTFTKIQATAF